MCVVVGGFIESTVDVASSADDLSSRKRSTGWSSSWSSSTPVQSHHHHQHVHHHRRRRLQEDLNTCTLTSEHNHQPPWLDRFQGIKQSSPFYFSVTVYLPQLDWRGFYARIIEFNPRRVKLLKENTRPRRWASTAALFVPLTRRSSWRSRFSCFSCSVLERVA